MQFEVDAKNIHDTFKGMPFKRMPFKRMPFKRIQWNCPFGGSSQEDREKFILALPKFFRSATQLQKPGDRIHIVLDQPQGYSSGRQVENPFIPAATISKYRLIRKRRFDESRYPGYEHQKTGKFERYSEETCGREFVFEKTDLPQLTEEEFDAKLNLLESDYKRDLPKKKGEELAIEIKEDTEKLEVKQEKHYQVFEAPDLENKRFEKVGGSNVRLYYGCSTDEDSSDYYSSDDE